MRMPPPLSSLTHLPITIGLVCYELKKLPAIMSRATQRTPSWRHNVEIKLACRLLLAGGRLIEHKDMAEKEAAIDGEGTMLPSTP